MIPGGGLVVTGQTSDGDVPQVVFAVAGGVSKGSDPNVGAQGVGDQQHPLPQRRLFDVSRVLIEVSWLSIPLRSVVSLSTSMSCTGPCRVRIGLFNRRRFLGSDSGCSGASLIAPALRSLIVNRGRSGAASFSVLTLLPVRYADR